MRVALFAVWVVVALIALLPILRHRSLPNPAPPLATDELEQTLAAVRDAAAEAGRAG